VEEQRRSIGVGKEPLSSPLGLSEFPPSEAPYKVIARPSPDHAGISYVDSHDPLTDGMTLDYASEPFDVW
jgi:hypothetical protein